eukprot:Awhi_evm1s13946
MKMKLHLYISSVILSFNDHTIFAPNNIAFEKIADAIDIGALDDKTLAEVLRGHSIKPEFSSDELLDEDAPLSYPTIAGTKVIVTTDGDVIYVNGAEIITRDIAGCNGVIHIIENVLLPADEGTTEPLDDFFEDEFEEEKANEGGESESEADIEEEETKENIIEQGSLEGDEEDEQGEGGEGLVEEKEDLSVDEEDEADEGDEELVEEFLLEQEGTEE